MWLGHVVLFTGFSQALELDILSFEIVEKPSVGPYSMPPVVHHREVWKLAVFPLPTGAGQSDPYQNYKLDLC